MSYRNWPEWGVPYCFTGANSMAGWNWETMLDNELYRLSTRTSYSIPWINGLRWAVCIQKLTETTNGHMGWADITEIPIPGESHRIMQETVDEIKTRFIEYLTTTVL